MQAKADGCLQRPPHTGRDMRKGGRSGQRSPFTALKMPRNHGSCTKPERITRGEHCDLAPAKSAQNFNPVREGHRPRDRLAGSTRERACDQLKMPRWTHDDFCITV